MTTLTPRTSDERTILALLERDYAPLVGRPDRIGGEMPGSVSELYVRLRRVAGPGAGRIQGTTVLDVECFSVSWATADSAAFDIEAILLGYPHTVLVDGRRLVIDSVFQNVGPQDLPWEDDRIARVGATYAITTRR